MEVSMRIKCSKPKISEYDFLRLLSSTMIIQKQNIIIKKYDLEKKLYYFYDNPDFHFLFEDVCKKESIDNYYVDLNIAFQSAYTFGLLVLIQDSGDKSIINLTEKQAVKINSEFNSNEIEAMNKLCKELKQFKDDVKPFTLTKSKKRNTMPIH